MIVTVSFWRDEDNNNRVRTIIHQDDPQRRDNGDYADLERHEVLELLNRLGLNQQESEGFMGLVLAQPPTVRRRQFQINQGQEAQVRQFFPGNW